MLFDTVFDAELVCYEVYDSGLSGVQALIQG